MKKYASDGERIALAVSGGADSMCLLHLAVETLGTNNLAVVNVEHGLRGEESLGDTEFVKNECLRLGVDFIGFSVDVPLLAATRGIGEESAARIARHACFDEAIADGFDYVMTAHHRSDNAETVLMHLLRGSGNRGLIGMSERDGYIVRPLINCTRAQIDKYCALRGVRFVVDSTNSDLRYTRNFVRRKVMPLLSERYDAESALVSLSKSAAEDEAFIRSQMNGDLIRKIGDEVKLDVTTLSLPHALSSRYVLDALCAVGLKTDVTRAHVCDVIALKDKPSGSEICLPHGYKAIREFDDVSFFSEKENADECEEIPFQIGITFFGDGIAEIYPCEPKPAAGRLIIDADKVPSGSVLRRRMQGDRFRPFGGGEKKLKEYLIDKKIPLRKRDNLLLLCYNHNVLAIFGVEIADSVRISDKTINAVELKYTEE